MHPDILWRLAADHIREPITEAGEARRAHEARHAPRRRLVPHLRRSTRLFEYIHDLWLTEVRGDHFDLAAFVADPQAGSTDG